MLATYCALVKSQINEMLKEHITHNMIEKVISSYFDENDILFFIGSIQNLNIEDIKNIIDNTFINNTKEDANNNFNKLINIMIGTVLTNHQISIIMFTEFIKIKTHHEIFDKSMIWIEMIYKAIDNGNYELVCKLSNYVCDKEFNNILKTKIKEIELSNNSILIMKFIHLLKYINYNEYFNITLNILLKKLDFDLINEFITCVSYKIDKNTLIFIIDKLPPIESYEYFLDNIQIYCKNIFDDLYTEIFYDINIIQHKTLHTYAKKIISLLTNQLIISEYNRHDAKRKRPKNGIEHIIQYLKDEKIKRNITSLSTKEKVKRHHLRTPKNK
jgi:hypothetical protein